MTISLSAARAAGFNVPGIDRQVNPTSRSNSSSFLFAAGDVPPRPNITKNQPKAKRTTKMLSYPTGLGDNDQGHWILFEILGQNKGQLAAAKDKERQAKERAAAASSEYGDFRGDSTGLGQVVNRDQTPPPDKEEKWYERSPDANLLNSSIQMKRRSTTRLDTVIALYMPPSVQVKYDVAYADQEIGLVAETGLAAIKAFQGQQGGLVDKTISGTKAITQSAGAGIAQFGMDKVAGMVQGGDAVIAIERGQVITPRMELMFEGMGRRSFSYSFTFIPKSEDEAITVEDIVLHFKRHMMPNFANSWTSGVDGVREMTIPDHFNIRYMYRHKTNTHLNLIHTCALTSMDVDYGAERFTGYADGRPQTTKISLNFTEFNIMSRAHIDQGY